MRQRLEAATAAAIDVLERVKESAAFYGGILWALAGSMIPTTVCTTHYIRELGYTQFLEVDKKWLGMTLESRMYELADTPEKKELLDKLLEAGEITEAEHKKYLSPLREQR